jgi:tetratricopeptide (TPR) repeat protein
MKQLHKHIFVTYSATCLRVGMMVLLLLLAVTDAPAQVTRYLNQGNTLYGQKRYKEAAADYAKAVAKNPTYTPGLFNLGNSLYQQKQFDSSRKVMEATEKVAKDKGSKAAANYNIGNTYMSQQKWEEAIDAYKKTLRANPQDADAKYNLSYAEQMLKKQEQENKDKKDKQDKDKKDDKDKDQKKDQDKKDDQNKDNKENKDNQDKDNKDQKDQEKQQPQSQPSKLSQKQAEQLLNALKEEEKKLQDKMKKEKGVPVKMGKDW